MESIRSEAIRIARLAGIRIKELREKKQYQEFLKDGYELVTTADLISNDLIKTEISRIFPNHHILSEEDSEQKGLSIQQPTWIIDPIDGTVGYANDQYQVAVSIAFAVEDKVRVGVVYNPFLDEMFYASEGSGAFLNDQPIRVKDVHHLKECVIGTGFPHKRDNIRNVIALLENILPNIRDIRRLGSPALDICWVACGRMQGFYEGKLHPWDVAAAKLIAVEAGAKTGYYSAEQNMIIPDCINGDSVIVSSPRIFDEFQKTLTNKLFLVEPQERYKEELEKMVEEYRAYGEKEYFELYKEAVSDFNGYVLKLNDNAKGRGLPDGWVPAYTYWLTNMKDEILGVVRIRTSLNNEFVRKIAGHIGYDISPLSRRKGYGNTLLKLALEKAAMINLDNVLITCDDDNIASRRIIENNGGIFESEIFNEGKCKQLRRYWITLGV